MTETIVVGLLTFLFGLVLGHRMTLWRDQRKEFNEVATRIRVALKARMGGIGPYFGRAEKIDAADSELFDHLNYWWKRGAYRRAWAAYETECASTRQDEMGQVFYKRPQTVDELLGRIIRCISLR